MLYPVAILFDIDKKKLRVKSDKVIDALKNFCSVVNLLDDSSLVYLDEKDKTYAMCEVKLACMLSTEYNNLDKRDYTPAEFLADTDLGEGWSDEDTMSYICRCLDMAFKLVTIGENLEDINDSIKIYIEDLKGTMFTFKYVNEMTITCSDIMLKYYERTVDGFKYEKVGDKDYKVSFKPIVVPVEMEEKKFSIIFDLALLGYEKKANELIEGLLKVYKVATELDITVR